MKVVISFILFFSIQGLNAFSLSSFLPSFLHIFKRNDWSSSRSFSFSKKKTKKQKKCVMMRIFFNNLSFFLFVFADDIDSNDSCGPRGKSHSPDLCQNDDRPLSTHLVSLIRFIFSTLYRYKLDDFSFSKIFKSPLKLIIGLFITENRKRK